MKKFLAYFKFNCIYILIEIICRVSYSLNLSIKTLNNSQIKIVISIFKILSILDNEAIKDEDSFT